MHPKGLHLQVSGVSFWAINEVPKSWHKDKLYYRLVRPIWLGFMQSIALIKEVLLLLGKNIVYDWIPDWYLKSASSTWQLIVESKNCCYCFEAYWKVWWVLAACPTKLPNHQCGSFQGPFKILTQINLFKKRIVWIVTSPAPRDFFLTKEFFFHTSSLCFYFNKKICLFRLEFPNSSRIGM